MPRRSPPVTDAYADLRIREKIDPLPQKPKAGLARLADELKEAGMAPSARLHYVSAIADLGRLADATRAARIHKHDISAPREPPEHDWRAQSYKD